APPRPPPAAGCGRRSTARTPPRAPARPPRHRRRAARRPARAPLPPAPRARRATASTARHWPGARPGRPRARRAASARARRSPGRGRRRREGTRLRRWRAGRGHARTASRHSTRGPHGSGVPRRHLPFVRRRYPRRMPASTASADDVRRGAADLSARYRAVRARTVALAAPLSAEDAMVQSMPDASPAKWHLAHTTWFFERFVLAAREGYAPVDRQWDYLFNSYYNSVGPMHARPRRGLVSRPSLIEVLEYREEVDARMARRFETGDFDEDAARVVLLGTHHEQQHQELLLT